MLQSGDALNLKAILKQLIRDATNQKTNVDDEDAISTGLGVGILIFFRRCADGIGTQIT